MREGQIAFTMNRDLLPSCFAVSHDNNDDLGASDLAKLLFLQNIDYEFLGPMYISSAARSKGHQSQVAVGRTLQDFAPTIDRFRPDIIGFSVMSGSHLWARRIAAQVKQACGIPNIFGGAHPTFFPEFANEPEVDMIVRGEGEESMVEILDRLEARQPLDDVPNLCFARNGVLIQRPLRELAADPDTYPFPDRDLYHPFKARLNRHIQAVITSRGCPYHCTFCFEDSMRDLYRGKGKYVRIRHPEKVVEECVALKRKTDVRLIYFADDVFGINKSWLYEFLPLYQHRVGLSFICLLRADIVASDETYALRLAEAGCRSAFFGIETGSEKIRNKILGKKLSDADIFRAADLLRQAGIQFRTYNILGLPDETLQDAFSTLEMNIRIRTDYPWCSIFSPYPGTALADYASKKGYMPEHFAIGQLSESFFMRSHLVLPNIHEIENLQKFFQTAVLWPCTLPLIRRLIRVRPNRLFDWWFGLVYFYTYIKSENRGVWETLKFALRNFRHILSKE